MEWNENFYDLIKLSLKSGCNGETKGEARIIRLNPSGIMGKNKANGNRQSWIEYPYFQAFGCIHIFKSDFLILSKGITRIKKENSMQRHK